MNKKILIADDDAEFLKLAEHILNGAGYETCTASNGSDALKKVYKELPDLLLLDFSMPGMDGDEVCWEIRKDNMLQHLPIIILSASGEIQRKLMSFNIGADDYIAKPFRKEELLGRIKVLISRINRSLDANPLTKLPGNNTITRELAKRIRNNEHFSVLYIDINNFKSFNDNYGFLKGDSLIRETAKILLEITGTNSNRRDFVGHIGGDDFIVITKPKRMHLISSQIIEAFDKEIPKLYNQEDRKNGYIFAKNRQNKRQKFPLSSIAIGVVTSQNRKFNHVGELSALGTELNKYAKSFNKSAYVVNKRASQESDVNN